MHRGRSDRFRLMPVAFALALPACFEKVGSSAEGGADDGGSGTAGEGTSGGGEATTGEVVPNCEEYCVFLHACDETNPQYSTAGPCERVCAKIPVGTPEDQVNNTLGCRWFYALEAGEQAPDNVDECQKAGPTGGPRGAEACGSACANFCDLAAEVCPAIFGSIAECVSTCADWAADPPYSSVVMEADNYACRLKHLTYATLNPGTHCPHIADVSAVCNDG